MGGYETPKEGDRKAQVVMYAEVCLNLPIKRSFHYLVPHHLEKDVGVGKRVLVPFGKRRLFGFVLSTPNEAPTGIETREILEVVDQDPLLHEDLLHLASWMEDYYLCPIGEVIHGFLPPGLTKRPRRPKGKPDPTPKKTDPLTLTPSQQEVFDVIKGAIEEGGYRSFLLHGVTGSGKTEIYLQAIDVARRRGKGAVVLIPEISLTKQTLERFRCRFGEDVAVLHSGLRPSQRASEWRRVRDGRARIVVGARSAVFSPIRNVGLIIVDEEHETSYKQDERSPRYHGRDVAIMRGMKDGAIVLLGSATPSIESYHNTTIGKSTLLTLCQRIDHRPLPSAKIIDMRREKGKILSKVLMEEIHKRLKVGEKVILFLNRRGHSSFILCRECGDVGRCPRCNLALTYHLQGRRMMCHYCGYTRSAPDRCGSCGGVNMDHMGIGTQRVEEEIGRVFPDEKVLRMDRDTTRRPDSYHRILSSFETGDAKILLGTQMVAKGFDFPDVTLVGVILADIALNLPDFRASERTFNLLTQVGGRAGRGQREGMVIIQTYNPDHYSIVAASHHDYHSFYKKEIILRRELSYPPFVHLVILRLKGRDEKRVIDVAEGLGEKLREGAHRFGTIVLGPAPCPLPKIRGEFRWQILIKGKSPTRMRGLIRECLDTFTVPRGVRLGVDVDPVGML
jgi:primosomal protein N' (replication factor Y)